MSRLALFFDGTWQQAHQLRPTNVALLHGLVAPAARRYYDPGVGTGRFDRIRGGVAGVGLAQNVLDAYVWLADHYDPGDRLYLFGFSRGAYTARSVAGLVASQGIPDGREEAHRRFRAYRRQEQGDGSEVWFVGVWDTVGSLGIPVGALRWTTAWRHRFHDVALHPLIRHAHHALALDERRKPFRPALWVAPPRDDQVVEQVWFPGAHADVGGGAAGDVLSDRALIWMAHRAAAADLPLVHDPPDPLSGPFPHGPIHDSLSRSYRALRLVECRIPGARPATGEYLFPSVSARLTNSNIPTWRSA